MNIQIGSVSGGNFNVGGVTVVCPECQNGSSFTNVNVSSDHGGTLRCGACRVWLVIRNRKVETDE